MPMIGAMLVFAITSLLFGAVSAWALWVVHDIL
jgi:hypothetical protein